MVSTKIIKGIKVGRLLSSTGPIENFVRHLSVEFDTLASLLYDQTNTCFHGGFDSQCKIVWGESRTHGVPIHKVKFF